MHYDQWDKVGHFLLRNLGFMGCLFGCFGVKYGRRQQPHLVSDSGSTKFRVRRALYSLFSGESCIPPERREESRSSSTFQDSMISQNQLSSLLLREEQPTSAPSFENGTPLFMKGTGDGGDEDKDLKDEAKFLKTCGALLQTPAEIRKTSEKQDGEDGLSKYHSWLPGTSCKRLSWDEHPDEVFVYGQLEKPQEKENSASPTKEIIRFASQKEEQLHDDKTNPSDRSVLEGPEADGQPYNARNSGILSSASPESSGLMSQLNVKSVRFECNGSAKSIEHFISLEGTPSQNEIYEGVPNEKKDDFPNHEDRRCQRKVLSCSPYPTPLKVTDDMQTPGTFYPVEQENFTVRKSGRIRTQYVFPVLDPEENLAQWTAPRECSDSSQVDLSDEIAQQDHPSRPLEVVAGEDCAHYFGRKPCPAKNSDADRPIIGAVAAHWNDEDSLTVSPKEWDGNGIPNSTTKYKEDQKVNWHATPFEERLEKALSDERLLPRKLSDEQPVHFGESINDLTTNLPDTAVQN